MSDPDLQVGDQIVEVNGVDFTSVDHKEVSLLNESVSFCYHERLFYMSFRRALCGQLNSPNSRKKQSVFKQELNDQNTSVAPDTGHFWKCYSFFLPHLQAVRVLKSSRSLTITVLTGAVSTLP